MSEIVKVIVGAATFIYFVIQGYIIFVTGEFAAELTSSQYGQTDPLAGNVDITGIREGGRKPDNSDGRLKQDYVLMAAHDRLLEYRTVSAAIAAPLSALLNTGEKAPDADVLDVFLAARSGKVAESECEIIAEAFAAECAVEHSSARKANLKDAYFLFDVRLSFREKATFGTFDPAGAHSFNAVAVDGIGETDKNSRGRKTAASGAAATRKDLYRVAARGCEEIRREFGNCSITGVSIAAQSHKDATLWMTGSASYAYLAPRTGS